MISNALLKRTPLFKKKAFLGFWRFPKKLEPGIVNSFSKRSSIIFRKKFDTWKKLTNLIVSQTSYLALSINKKDWSLPICLIIHILFIFILQVHQIGINLYCVSGVYKNNNTTPQPQPPTHTKWPRNPTGLASPHLLIK